MNPSTNSDEISADELAERFGPETASWADAGVRVIRDGADRVVLWHCEEKIGTILVDQAVGSGAPQVIVWWPNNEGGESGLAYAVGFVPADPVKARDTERERWRAACE